MSFTVLRVEVQQWEYEQIFPSVCGQSEEGVEADEVVKEEGHQEDGGYHGVMTGVKFDSLSEHRKKMIKSAKNEMEW